CSLDAGPYVGMEVYRAGGGERVIHLLNYDNETPLDSVSLGLEEGLRAECVRVLSPDWDCREAMVTMRNGRVEFGPLETYAVVVVPPLARLTTR
ncbi:MAG: hypothetical protein HON70_15590, partial [Lentisphaerae bacterium]|nr:hypothetical protein [Lentisphaerota bacterium]